MAHKCHRDMTMAWYAAGVKRRHTASAGVGDIPTFHSAGDIDSLKNGLKAKIGVVDPVARACAKLSTNDETGWGTFYLRVMDYANSPTPLTVNIPSIQQQWIAGTSYSDAIDIWIQKLNALGCNVPIVNVPPRESLGDTLIRYGAIAGGVALALGLAYGVFSVVRVAKEV